MSCSEPNKIQEYYIAYFDILGYKEFFKQQTDKVPELLQSIHEVIQRTKNHLNIANKSPIMNGMGNIEICSKVFSDNIFMCMQVTNSVSEQIRLLVFFQIVADIQRGFVNEYGLFVRGSILKGKISINEDYVFGQGLIDAVRKENEALYPRIVIDEDLIAFLREIKIVEMNNKQSDNLSHEEASCERENLYTLVQSLYERLFSRLVMQWADGKWVLCYLVNFDIPELLGEKFRNNALHFINSISTSDFRILQQSAPNFDDVLNLHKTRIEEQLKKYGKNMDIAIGEMAEAEKREKILRKYIWVMAFHNCVCDFYQRPNSKIFTQCNCDSRFIKMTIELL